MRYITGLLAFGVDCERDSCGKWNITKDEWLDENRMKLQESDDSPFKNYGIEENKIIPYHEYCLYAVADHVRAYCDMLYNEQFDELKDLFEDSIRSMKCRRDIFMLTYGKLRYLAQFHAINEFMTIEFGNAWVSYVDAINSMAEHINNRANEIEKLEAVQKEQDVLNPLYQVKSPAHVYSK